MENRFAALGRRTTLRGRDGECALLDDLISAIRRGESRALVIRGEPGVGKTALLEHLAKSGSDLSIRWVVGVESEMELAYAGLHRLCGPLLDRLPRLGAGQREALEIVFGLSAGARPDRFLVGVAMLSLLSDAADERPLLCVVDDAQWLDQASAATLALVARRLLAERVGIVFAEREPSKALEHVPELELRGVSDADARALLTSAVRFKLDERVRDRIVEETRGNPLALLELPRGLTVTQLAGGFGLVGAQGLSGPIEDSFLRRLATASADARRMLLLAAAEPTGDPVLLWRAAERLGIGPAAAADPEAHELLAIGERVTFRHPLVRSAVYRSATVDDRRAIHLALSEATDRESEPDRRAWHLAAAAAGPDEQIASELERSAERAQARGGFAASAAFLQRAVELTQDPTRRAERALAGAQASLQAGAFDVALALLAAAEAAPLDESQRARVVLLRGRTAFAAGRGHAPGLLFEAARRLEPFDIELARESYLTAWGAAVGAGYYAEENLLPEICRAVQALPAPAGPPRPLDLLLDGLAVLITDGRAAATPRLRRAAKALLSIPVDDVLRWGWMATAAAIILWDVEGLRATAERNLQLVREAGALSELPVHLDSLGTANAWMGDFAGTGSLITEAESVAAATGSRFAPFMKLRLRTLQGREAEASELMAAATELSAATGQAVAAIWAQWAAAVLYNGLARYEEAFSAARQATSQPFEPLVSAWALIELVEAAARGGHPSIARDAVEQLAETTQPSGTDFALGVEARCRALVSCGETADGLYREAIDRLGRTRLRPELARAHLLYGEWLRREQHRMDAREELRAAHGQFTSIGMEAFAERAWWELQATGEKVGKRTVEGREQLTAQELQIARLARDGVSNREIAERLFLSPRTVEWHLRNAFTKLGIRSRYELPSPLPGPDS